MWSLLLPNSVSSNLSSEDHPNNIYIAGFSDQILRFIAERGDTGQLNHVENIDKAYSLKDLNVSNTTYMLYLDQDWNVNVTDMKNWIARISVMVSESRLFSLGE